MRLIPRIKTRIPIYTSNHTHLIPRIKTLYTMQMQMQKENSCDIPLNCPEDQVKPYGMAALQASTSPRHNHVINECMNNYRMNAATGHKILGIQHKNKIYLSRLRRESDTCVARPTEVAVYLPQ